MADTRLLVELMGDQLSADVIDFIADNSRSWFPELGSAVSIVVEQNVRRIRSSVVTLRLQSGSKPDRANHVVVKIELPGAAPLAERPRLGICTTDLDGKHALEWNGLVAAWEAFGTGRHAGLAAVRPLAHLPDMRAIIVGRVDDPTLRIRLLAASRLGGGRRRADVLGALFGLGRWLGAFHAMRPAVASVRASGTERVKLAEEYVEFLGGRHAGAADLARRLVDLADDLEPTMELGLGHGDLAPRNAFISANGAVTVIDILARWRVPIYEDIAFLLTELRMAGPELVLRGRAFPNAYQETLEEQFLQGYVAETGVNLDPALLAWYSAIIVVDKCAAAVTRGAVRGRERIRFELVSRRLDDEIARAVAQLRARIN